MTTKFKCDKCKCQPEELWSFGPFGLNSDKSDKEYCLSCFESILEQNEQSPLLSKLDNIQSKNQGLEEAS